MRKLLSQGILFAAVAALGVAASGCSQYNGLKAKRTFRDANGMYQSSDYKAAAAKYEQVTVLDEGTLHQFHLEPAFFFLANSGWGDYDTKGAKKPGSPAVQSEVRKLSDRFAQRVGVSPDDLLGAMPKRGIVCKVVCRCR